MLDQYIARYGPRLFGLCLTLCRSRPEAEDLYQDTWLRVLSRWEQYDRTKPFPPWLTRICVNLYRNRLRRLARSPVLDRFRTAEEKDAFFSSVPAPAEEDFSALHAAVDALPEKLRLAVVLYYFQELDIRAAARALGVPEGTVKSRLGRARRQLREVLNDETDLSV